MRAQLRAEEQHAREREHLRDRQQRVDRRNLQREDTGWRTSAARTRSIRAGLRAAERTRSTTRRRRRRETPTAPTSARPASGSGGRCSLGHGSLLAGLRRRRRCPRRRIRRRSRRVPQTTYSPSGDCIGDAPDDVVAAAPVRRRCPRRRSSARRIRAGWRGRAGSARPIPPPSGRPSRPPRSSRFEQPDAGAIVDAIDQRAASRGSSRRPTGRAGS